MALFWCAVCDDTYKTRRFDICSLDFCIISMNKYDLFYENEASVDLSENNLKKLSKNVPKGLTKREMCAIILKLSEEDVPKQRLSI